MKTTFVALLAAAAVAAPLAAHAQAAKVASGTFNGITWEAQSRLVGVTPTAGVTGGDPLYFAAMPQYSGVVGLLMDYGTAAFVCSGTLLPDRRSILTAAHCVSDGAGTPNPLSTTVFFQPQGGLPFDQRIYGSSLAERRTVTDYFVNANYTGEVIDQNDIAVLRIDGYAPNWAADYALSTEADLLGDEFNVAGYGARSDIGGAFGTTATPAGLPPTAGVEFGRTGFLRQGNNNYSYRFGDPIFGGFWTDRDAAGENFFGFADIEFSWVSDFDNGLAVNDTGCRIAGAVTGVALGGPYCNTGLGAIEVGVAGGDSGGPGFINGQIASVNSYGLSFGTAFGDFRAGLNSSFGEFSGYVPVNIHTAFINSAMVSEPAAFSLLGLGLAGLALTRRRRAQ